MLVPLQKTEHLAFAIKFYKSNNKYRASHKKQEIECLLP